MAQILEEGRGARMLRGGAWTIGSARRSGPWGRVVSHFRSAPADLAAGLLLLAAICLVLVVTPHGIGLSPDSLTYVGAANNLDAGLGFSVPPANEPIAHLAPLYSGLLALLGLAGGGPLEAARWVAALCFGLNVLLVYLLAARVLADSGVGSSWIPVAAAGLVLTAPVMWQIHLMAWTEPVFICASLCALWLLSSYLGGREMKWLVLAAAMAAVTIATRYAGLSLWAGLAGSLVLFQRRSKVRAVADAALFSVISLAPFGLWSLRNLWIAGTATNRSIGLHPISGERAREGLSTVASWLLIPDQWDGWIKLSALAIPGILIVAGSLLWSSGRAHSGRRDVPEFVVPPLVKTAVLTAVVYMAFLVASISFADDNTPLDQRILSPLFVLLLIPLVYGIVAWGVGLRWNRRVRLGILALVGLFSLLQFGVAYPILRDSRATGVGFSNVRWREPGLMRALREIPAGKVIYSNSPDALFFLSGRAARKLPVPFVAMTRSVNERFRDEVAQVDSDLAAGGLLVVLDVGPSQATRQADARVRELQLTPRRTFPNGVIYSR
ncbi:MAG: glycosyltransferase family 39 protein [Acidobacteriota bacterium]